MHYACLRVRMVNPHPWLARGIGKLRYGAFHVVFQDALIQTLVIHRPAIDEREAVAGAEVLRIVNVGIVPTLYRGIVPPVITPAHIAWVVELHMLLQHRAARTQRQLHAPLHAIDSVDIAHPDRGASIRVRLNREIDRRLRHPVVRYRKIELDPERRPGASIPNARFLNRRIGVEHLGAIRFVGARVNMTAEIRKHGAFQVLVLEK